MDQRHASRRLAVFVVGIVAAGALVAKFSPAITPGYDASFTLAWGRDLAHGLALDFTHPSSPTPHPLALIAGIGAGFAPVRWATNAAGGLGVVAGLITLTLLGLVTLEVTASRVAVAVAVATAAVSAAVGLLVLGASSDIMYCAVGLGAVLLTLRGRPAGAVALFMVAALLRPEAVLLALVPLTQSFTAHRDPGRRSPVTRSAWVRTAGVFAAGLVLAVAAWLVTGAAGGDLLVALHSASTNAQVNNDPRGLIVALTHALPGLAGPTGWLTVGAAAAALAATILMRRASMPPARPVRTPVRDPRARVPVGAAQADATVVVGAFIGVALVAYLAQGLTGTPLVARYLLLPALLCLPVAARCVTLARRLPRTTQASSVVAVSVGAILIGASIAANVTGWQDVTHAQQVRAEAFAAATELLDTDLARHCVAPVVVRSPALVALTALSLGRPLRDITVADHAGDGVLLQPLTLDAAELAGYGPMTPLTQQAKFPTDAPPRQHNTHWALYSSCQP